MGVVLLGLGSRGDVQPMAVLAAALARAGVDARVVGLAEYAPLAAGLGAAYVPVAGSVADAARIAERNRTEFYRLLQKYGLTPGMFRDAAAPADSDAGSS